jgi:hypothetical protein
MDIMLDVFTLRNVNRPYTKEELEEMYKKDHSIKEEDKKSRLQRCVSFTDPDYDHEEKAPTSFVENVDKLDTTLCNDSVSSNKPSMMTNDPIFSTSP